MNSQNLALRIGGAIFGVLALVHGLRMATRMAVLVGGQLVPIWVNALGLIVTGLLCVWFWRLASARGVRMP